MQVADLHRRLSGVDLTIPIDTAASNLSSQGGAHSDAPSAPQPTKSGKGLQDRGPEDRPLFPHEYAGDGLDEELLQEKRKQIYAAALRADQNAKLAIFATRPAIYSPGTMLCMYVWWCLCLVVRC